MTRWVEPWQDGERLQTLRCAAAATDSVWHGDDDALSVATRGLRDAPVAEIFAAIKPALIDHGWLEVRLRHGLAAMRADPFFQPPVRVMNGAARLGLALEDEGRSSVSLIILRGEDRATADAAGQSVIFTSGNSLTHVLRSGGAVVHRYRVPPLTAAQQAAFTASSVSPMDDVGCAPLRPGDMWCIDQHWESYRISGGLDDVVLLQLYVHDTTPLPLREYDAATGRLVRLTASQRSASFCQMALTLLRALGAPGAGRCLADGVTAPDFSLRWQAMREWLALDPVAALPALSHMAAGDPHPDVRLAAAAALDIVYQHLSAHQHPGGQGAGAAWP